MQAPRSAPVRPHPPAEGEPVSAGGAAGRALGSGPGTGLRSDTSPGTPTLLRFQLETRRLGEQRKRQKLPRCRDKLSAEVLGRSRRCGARGRCGPSPPAPCPLPRRCPSASCSNHVGPAWRARRSASATRDATSCGSALCWPRSAAARSRSARSAPRRRTPGSAVSGGRGAGGRGPAEFRRWLRPGPAAGQGQTPCELGQPGFLWAGPTEEGHPAASRCLPWVPLP